MERYVTITKTQREAFDTIYRHNSKVPYVSVSNYKCYDINTRALNCLIAKGLVEIILHKGVEYYYISGRGRHVGCTNYNNDIDTTDGDYLKMVSSYNRKHNIL